LQQIADVVLSVDLEEIGAVKDQGDTTEGMRAVSNNLLKAARKIDKSVRVLSDIEPLLRLNPQLDAAFAQAFRDSGYLDYWKVEVESHPWRYDPVAMVQLYHGTNEKAALLEECRNVIQRDKEGQFAHWAASLSALETMLQLHPLETFRLQRDLYRTLNFNHKRRVDVANILLRTYGRNDADK
jgi:hypothetical protein